MRRQRIVFALVAGCVWCSVVVACGDDDANPGTDASIFDGSGPEPDGSGPGPDGSGPGPDGGGPGPDGGGPGPDAGGPTLQYCLHSCTTASDCNLGTPIYDADNYSCTGNVCQWSGCNDSSECSQTYSDPSWVCGTLPLFNLPSCYKACNTATDCNMGTVLYDGDNYNCTGGLCEWTGCNDSGECAEAYMDSSYVCGTLPTLPFPSCYKSCVTPADCDLTNTLFDANNYNCTGGLCEWTGCNDSAECVDAFSDNSYVCQ